MTHTKGKWEASKIEHMAKPIPQYTRYRLAIITDFKGWKDLILCWVYGGSHQETQANARLIASAPELLEALKEIVGQYVANLGSDSEFIITKTPLMREIDGRYEKEIPSYWQRAKEAINKAQGTTKTMTHTKGKLRKLENHLYKDVYSYGGHEIWLCEEIKTPELKRPTFFYYIDGNTLVTSKIILNWYPKFLSYSEALDHAQKRIDNIELEMELAKLLK